jgi:hypothetical protein
VGKAATQLGPNLSSPRKTSWGACAYILFLILVFPLHGVTVCEEQAMLPFPFFEKKNIFNNSPI